METSDIITFSEMDSERMAIIFSRDAEGVITGRVMRLKQQEVPVLADTSFYVVS